ncbi:MAG: WxcM-like domain-containing protein [Methanoregula sp.]|nr:WxcM-like domain-containing protein [Methanoregula sp.]
MLSDRLKRAKHIREDGWLAEIIPMNSPDLPFLGIHSYVVSITPGRSRANHYHLKKEEWIALAAGKILLSLEDTRTNVTEHLTLDTRSDDYRVVHIPPFIAHSVKNVGPGEASIVVFSKTPEDKADTFRYMIGE